MKRRTKIVVVVAMTLCFAAVSAFCFAHHQFREQEVGKKAFWKGQLFGRALLFQAAIKEFDFALTKPLDSHWRAQVLDNRAFCFLSLQRRPEAIRDYSEALRLEPGLIEAWANRGIAYAQNEQENSALADYSHAIGLDPNRADALFQRGLIYSQQHKYEQARTDFREAIRCIPNFEAAYIESGLASRNLNDRNGAFSGFEQAIKLRPRDPRPYDERAYLYFQSKEYAKALVEMNEAIRLAPRVVDYRFSRSHLYGYARRPGEKVADLDEILRLNPRNEDALLERGAAYRNVHDYQHAIADFSELMKITKERGAYLERARTYFRAGEYAPALADYKQAATAPEGKHQTEVRSLAWLLATCPDAHYRDGAEAVALAEKDCKRSGCHRSYELDTLAAAYAELGDFEKAIRYQQQARNLPEEGEEWHAEVEKRLILYRRHQPYREELEH